MILICCIPPRHSRRCEPGNVHHITPIAQEPAKCRRQLRRAAPSPSGRSSPRPSGRSCRRASSPSASPAPCRCRPACRRSPACPDAARVTARTPSCARKLRSSISLCGGASVSTAIMRSMPKLVSVKASRPSFEPGRLLDRRQPLGDDVGDRIVAADIEHVDVDELRRTRSWPAICTWSPGRDARHRRGLAAAPCASLSWRLIWNWTLTSSGW